MDLIKATEVCIYIAAEGVMMAKAIFMFFNSELIRGVLEDLQLMANESKIKPWANLKPQVEIFFAQEFVKDVAIF